MVRCQVPSRPVQLLRSQTTDTRQRIAGPTTRRATSARLRNTAAWGRARSACQELTWARLFDRREAKGVSRPTQRREYRKAVGTPTRAAGAWRVAGLAMRRLLADPKQLRGFNRVAAALLVVSLYPGVFGRAP